MRACSDERERGKFDSNLNFVFEKSNEEVDAWVAELDEGAMETAIGEAALALRRRRELQQRADTAAASRRVSGSFLQLCLYLLCELRPGETVARAMRRLKAEEPLAKGRARRGNPRVELLTDLADQLVSRGVTGAYELVFEALEQMSSQWQYRASDGTLQGPFSLGQIAGWREQGYFTGASAVPMRRVLRPDDRADAGAGVSAARSDDESDDDDEEDRPKATKRARLDRAADLTTADPMADPMADLDSEDEAEEDAPRDADADRAALLALAARSGCFDAEGFGPWVPSDEVHSLEPQDA